MFTFQFKACSFWGWKEVTVWMCKHKIHPGTGIWTRRRRYERFHDTQDPLWLPTVNLQYFEIVLHFEIRTIKVYVSKINHIISVNEEINKFSSVMKTNGFLSCLQFWKLMAFYRVLFVRSSCDKRNLSSTVIISWKKLVALLWSPFVEGVSRFAVITLRKELVASLWSPCCGWSWLLRYDHLVEGAGCFAVITILWKDNEFSFNDASTHKGHLRQNGVLTRFCNETVIMISHICIKCKTRTN